MRGRTDMDTSKKYNAEILIGIIDLLVYLYLPDTLKTI